MIETEIIDTKTRYSSETKDIKMINGIDHATMGNNTQ